MPRTPAVRCGRDFVLHCAVWAWVFIPLPLFFLPFFFLLFVFAFRVHIEAFIFFSHLFDIYSYPDMRSIWSILVWNAKDWSGYTPDYRSWG